jgi:plastocyanin
MRNARRLPLAVLGVLALAACSTATPGWTYAPAPPSTPVPSVAASGEPSGGASAAPSDQASPPPSGAPGSIPPATSAEPSAAPSGGAASPGAGAMVQVSATGIKFDQTSLEVPADAPFQIEFVNNDAGVPHDVAVREGSATGTEIFKGETFPGVATKVYDVPALPAGPYAFICTVHPTMVIQAEAK